MGRKAKEFKVGDFIFAKVKGYPAWPARVQGIKGKKYFVFFYGTREIANLAPNMIFDYAENKDKFLTKTVKRKDFNDGVQQIEHDFINNVPLEDVFGTDSCFEKTNPDISMTEGNATKEESTEDLNSSEAEEKVKGKPNKKGVEDSDEGALVIDEGKKGRKVKPPPKSPKTPRNVRKPLAEEEKDEEVVSRSGRKIKPKSRFIEEVTEEQLIAGVVPPTKKRRAATPEKKVVPEKKMTPEKKVTVEKKLTPEKKSQTDKSVKRYNTVAQSEIEDLKEPFNSSELHNILLAYLPSGKYIGVKLFQGRPTSFKSEAARLQWDKQAAKNAITLKMQLEKGEIKPDSVSTQVETALCLTSEEKANLDKDRDVELTRSRVQYLKTEMSLIEIDAKIKNCLSLERADTEQCLKLLDELKELDIQRLMLLKHPTCVQTVKRMRCYVGNAPAWDLAPDTHADFTARAATIRQCADNIYASYRDLFTIPAGLSFSQHFTDLVAKFKDCTSKLTNIETLELVVEPAALSRPTKLGKLYLDGRKGKKTRSPVKRKLNKENANKSDGETTESNITDTNTESDFTEHTVENMDTSDLEGNVLPIDKTENMQNQTDSDINVSEKQNDTSNDNEAIQPIEEAKEIDKDRNDKSINKKAQESKQNDNLKESSEKSIEANETSNETSDKTEELSDKPKVTSDKAKETSEKAKETSDKAKEASDINKETTDKAKASRKAKESTDKSKKSTENAKEINNKSKEISDKPKDTSDKSKETSDKTDEKNDKAKESNNKTKESSSKLKPTSEKSKSSNQKVKEVEKSTEEAEKLKATESNKKTPESSEKVKEAIDKSKSDKTKDSVEKSKDKSEKSKESDRPKETVDKHKDSKDKSKDKNEKDSKDKPKDKNEKDSKDKLKDKNEDSSEKTKEKSDKAKDVNEKDKDLKEKTDNKTKDKNEKQKEPSEKEKEKEKSNKGKDSEENDKKSDDSESNGEPKAKRLRETRKTESKPEPPKTPTKKKTK